MCPLSKPNGKINYITGNELAFKIASVLILINLTVFQFTNGQRLSLVKNITNKDSYKPNIILTNSTNSDTFSTTQTPMHHKKKNTRNDPCRTKNSIEPKTGRTLGGRANTYYKPPHRRSKGLRNTVRETIPNPTPSEVSPSTQIMKKCIMQEAMSAITMSTHNAMTNLQHF